MVGLTSSLGPLEAQTQEAEVSAGQPVTSTPTP